MMQVPPQNDTEDEAQVAPQDDTEEEDEAQQTASGVYLRGPASLPQRPIPRERRPMIRPEGER